MFPSIKDVDTKACDCGGVKVKNIFGFFYCQSCKRYFCPECGWPLKKPDNGKADCTYCGNNSLAESLVPPLASTA